MAKHESYHRAPSRFSTMENCAEKSYYKNKYFGEPHDKMFEKSRFLHIEKHVGYKDKSLIDIGCNTGFFIFEAMDKGAIKAHGYEGSQAAFQHLSAYVKRANENIVIDNAYFNFEKAQQEHYDIVHLLNVVHHLGDDYGKTATETDLINTKKKIISQINTIAHWSEYLIFQMGFNLHGDIKQPLFQSGTKKEMIDFISEGVKFHWNIESIGIAQSKNNHITYQELDDVNINRDDSLGEFLNRPIFILKSLIKKAN